MRGMGFRRGGMLRSRMPLRGFGLFPFIFFRGFALIGLMIIVLLILF